MNNRGIIVNTIHKHFGYRHITRPNLYYPSDRRLFFLGLFLGRKSLVTAFSWKFPFWRGAVWCNQETSRRNKESNQQEKKVNEPQAVWEVIKCDDHQFCLVPFTSYSFIMSTIFFLLCFRIQRFRKWLYIQTDLNNNWILNGKQVICFLCERNVCIRRVCSVYGHRGCVEWRR